MLRLARGWMLRSNDLEVSNWRPCSRLKERGEDPFYLLVADQNERRLKQEVMNLGAKNLTLKRELKMGKEQQRIGDEEGYKRMNGLNRDLCQQIAQKDKQITKLNGRVEKLKSQVAEAKKELSARSVERRNFLRNKRGRETKMEWSRAGRK